jgi:gamma-glutamylcyclotransferase (GGCT)/AIG2-like uncharacterized protein YtfP
MKSDTGSELVFVYGTLRRGGSNAFRMDGAEFVGRGSVAGCLHAISWYPGLVLGNGCGRVVGEVYRVGAEHLRALDEFEGISASEIEGAEYRRVRVEVIPDAGTDTWIAWAYEWKGAVDEGALVWSGDWLDVVQPRMTPVFTWVGVAATALLLLPIIVGSQMLMSSASMRMDSLPLRAVVASFYALPVVGIASSWMAHRRRERFPLAKTLVAGVCAIWLVIWIGIGVQSLAR